MPALGASDFAWSFGVNEDELPMECKEFLKTKGGENAFEYRVLVGKERDEEILGTLKRIEQDTQVAAASEQTQVWQDKWAETLQEFIDSGYNLAALAPKYYLNCTNTTIRWKQEYIKSDNPSLQLDFWHLMRLWLFQTYFSSYKTIYEFGCGPGYNLIMLSKMFPDKEIIGLDVTPSAVDLINLLHEKANLPVRGKLFDMIHPDESFPIKKDSLVFTSCSIEQLGNQYEAFIDYLLKAKPSLCIHVESLAEVYDQENLLDYIAYRYLMKRHYPNGLLTLIQGLANKGKAEILKVKRCYFGSVNHERYNLIIWRPI